MAQILTVIDRKGQPQQFEITKITEPLLDAFRRIKVLPQDKDPRPIVDVIAERVVNRLEDGGKRAVTKDEIVETHRVVFRDILNSTNGEVLTQREVLIYMEEFLSFAAGVALVENGIISADKFTPDGIPRKKVSKIWEWNVTHDCQTVEKLNEWVLETNGKKFSELVKMAEERYAAELREAAEIILHRTGAIYDIFHGPSSSGKTTTANRTRDLVTTLSNNETTIRWLEVDMYFKRKEDNPRYEYLVKGKNGAILLPDWDYETPLAYDLITLQQDLTAVVSGKKIMAPHYDFGKGLVFPKNTEFLPLKENEKMGIDCLHGGSREISGLMLSEKTVRIFIEAQNTIHDGNEYTRWTDVRLIRRMLRDIATRGHGTLLTLLHWHLVRKGELMHIVPLVNNADVLINGGMPYELPVFKRHAERFFRAYLKVLEKNSHLGDAYVRCERICKLFDRIETASEAQIASIPPNSVIREFVGGSVYYPKFPYGVLDTKQPEDI